MPTVSRRATPTEHQIQVAVFDWRAMMLPQIPQLALLHAIPNGAKLPFRKKLMPTGRVVRVCPQADYLKREGLTPGILDVAWPVARGCYHGLYIEHKAGRNPLSDDQERIAAMLSGEGYKVVVSRDAEYSINTIQAYWRCGPFRPLGTVLL